MEKYKYKVKGKNYEVDIEKVIDNIAMVTVNGKSFEVEIINMKPSHNAKQKVKLTAPKPVSSTANPPVAPPPPQAPAGTGKKVTAPLPGTITDVLVKVGDVVKAGSEVVILEAMKMQNHIEAENSGTVTSVLVNKGDAVLEGTTLITIE